MGFPVKVQKWPFESRCDAREMGTWLVDLGTCYVLQLTQHHTKCDNII